MAEHKWLFGLITFLSIILFNLGAIIMLSVYSFNGLTNYVAVGVYSLVLGFIIGIVINKTTESSRKLIIGSILVSLISALLIYSFISTLLSINTQTADTLVGGTEFFGIPGNPIILAAVIFVFFNLPFFINQFRIDTPDIEAKNLLLYVYGAIILAALCFVSSLALNIML